MAMFLLVVSNPPRIVDAADNKVFYNIRDYGAKGNGTMLDTAAINKAIDAAAAKGGGT